METFVFLLSSFVTWRPGAKSASPLMLHWSNSHHSHFTLGREPIWRLGFMVPIQSSAKVSEPRLRCLKRAGSPSTCTLHPLALWGGATGASGPRPSGTRTVSSPQLSHSWTRPPDIWTTLTLMDWTHTHALTTTYNWKHTNTHWSKQQTTDCILIYTTKTHGLNHHLQLSAPYIWACIHIYSLLKPVIYLH